MHPIEMMAISEVRSVAMQVLLEQEVPPDMAEAAQGAIQSALQEAASFNLSPADVIRAVFGPVFQAKDGCDRPSCKSREEGLSQHVGLHSSGLRS